MAAVDHSALKNTVKTIFAGNRGILAVDERQSSLEKKFKNVGIKNTAENRAFFREIMFKSIGLDKYIGGAILNEETFDQLDSSGTHLHQILTDKGILVGVKLDKGLKKLGEELISEGIEDLERRIVDFPMASFTKWRSLFKVDENHPSSECIEKNTDVLCKFARISQEYGMVPIVESEIFYEGKYTIDRMKNAASQILTRLYSRLAEEGVFIPGIILKISFIAPGKESKEVYECTGVAMDNIEIVSDNVPRESQAIAFLSGGHSSDESISLLNAVNSTNKDAERIFSFSFGRALTDSVLEAWRGESQHAELAQKALLERCFRCHKSVKGEYEG